VRSGYLTREQLAAVVDESERSARPLADLLRSSGRMAAPELDEVQDLLTRETVFDIMRRKTGHFHFSAESIVHRTPPERLLGAEQILMDGLRMLDEWQTFIAAVPSEETVFRRVGSLESSRALAQGGDDRLGHVDRILGLIDGRLNVRRVIDLSRIGTFEATRVLAELRQAGLIEVGVEDVRRAPRPRPTPTSPWLGLRAAVATAVPFVLLAALAATAPGRGASGAGLSGSPIPDRTLQQIRTASEREVLRQLLELHFFETGRYPDRLDALGERASGLGLSLTPARLADYYYVVRNDEVVLLAPME
jgi:hypothetical protein